MSYKAYPTSLDTPSRLARKRARKDVFAYNKYQFKKNKKSKRKEK